MSPRKTFHGLMLIVTLAFLGFLLVYIPPQIVAQYRVVKEFGQVWVYVYFSVVGIGAVLLLGAGLWIVWQLWRRTLKKRERRQRQNQNPSQLSRDQQQQEIDENLAAVASLQSDPAIDDGLRREIAPRVQQIETKREAAKLEIVAFGTISSGKSSLLNALAGRDLFATDAKGGTTVQRNETDWPGLDRVTLIDTPGLGEIDGAEHVAISTESAKNADLVLLTVDGPLRDSEARLLEHLGGMEKRVLVCLNKEDWYDAADRERLLGQLREQVRGHVPAENVVAVRAKPAMRLRKRIAADGSERDEPVEVPPDIGPLAERMLAIVRAEGPGLLLANLLLQSRGLVEESQRKVKETLDARAWEIVNRYAWGAGGAAALSPFPLVDLAAGCAISSKMVVDLAAVYRQEIDAAAAVNLLGQLGKNLLSILGVSMATPLVAALAGSLLKTVPGIGTIAGGVLQGVVQALVTRWIGAVFIGYFRDEMRQPDGGLAGLARREWERLTTVAELKKLVDAARERFRDRT